MDEYSLLKQLAELFPASPFAEADALRDPLKMFRVHYLLFHSLYLLSDELRATGHHLHISPLGIRLELSATAEPGLQQADPLSLIHI